MRKNCGSSRSPGVVGHSFARARRKGRSIASSGSSARWTAAPASTCCANASSLARQPRSAAQGGHDPGSSNMRQFRGNDPGVTAKRDPPLVGVRLGQFSPSAAAGIAIDLGGKFLGPCFVHSQISHTRSHTLLEYDFPPSRQATILAMYQSITVSWCSAKWYTAFCASDTAQQRAETVARGAALHGSPGVSRGLRG